MLTVCLLPLECELHKGEHIFLFHLPPYFKYLEPCLAVLDTSETFVK